MSATEQAETKITDVETRLDARIQAAFGSIVGAMEADRQAADRRVAEDNAEAERRFAKQIEHASQLAADRAESLAIERQRNASLQQLADALGRVADALAGRTSGGKP